MNDVIKTIKAQLYDRAISPLSGAFIASWCIWNWRLLTTIFSDMPVEEKFIYIDTVIFANNYLLFEKYEIWPLNWIVLPLLTSILLIFVYPYPARFAYGYWKKQQQLIKKIQQEIEDEEPITQEEYKQIKKDILEANARHDIELEREIEKNKKLQIILNEYETNEANNKKIKTNTRNMGIKSSVDLTKEENKNQIFDILRVLDQEEFTEINEIIREVQLKYSSLDATKIKHYIDLLESYKFIYGAHNKMYKINPSGRNMLVNQDLNDLNEKINFNASQ